MPFAVAGLMLLNSYQFRLIIAELMFCMCFRMRKGMHLVLTLGIALLVSLPEMLNLVWGVAFYTSPQLSLCGFNFSFLIIFGISLLLMGICFRVTFSELLFLGAGAYISQNLIYNTAWLVKMFFFPEIDSYLIYDNMNYFTTNTDTLFYNIISVFILAAGYAVIYQIFIKKWNREHQIYVERIKLIVFLLLTILLLNIISSMAANTDSANVFVVILLAACSITLLMIQFNIFDLSKERYEKEMEKYMVSTALHQQKMSQEAVNLINIKAHDLKRSLEAIKHELNGTAVEEELISTEQAIRDYDSIIDVGNDALNTILTEKNLFCVQNNIELTFMADGSALHFMKSIDIYLLFGNALDNAIERLLLEDIDNRIVSLKVFTKDIHTVISLENYCSDKLEFKDGMPQTIKPDKDQHGFGMKSISAIVDKYHGNMVVKQEDNKFILHILF